MTQFADISKLRKEGKLREAYFAAEELTLTDPESIWSKRAMMWVVYDYAKQSASLGNQDAFLRCVKKVTDLKVPSDEEMFLNAMFAVVRNMVRKCVGDTASTPFLDSLWKEVSQWDVSKPGDIYSGMLNTFLKVKDQWLGFASFCRWWNFDNLTPNDFTEPTLPDGKKGLSLAEKTYMAYSKALLSQGVKSDIDEWIPRLEELCERHPTYIYLPYYLIKLMIVTGGSDAQIERHIKPLLKKKPNEFWIWELIADSLSDVEQRFSALCKAMTCRTPDRMSIALRERMAILLLERGCYAEAKHEFEEVARIRMENKWRIPASIHRYLSQQELTDVLAAKDNRVLYLQHSAWAEDKFIGTAKPVVVQVTHINEDKGFVSFVTKQRNSGFFREKSSKRRKSINKGDRIEIMVVKIERNKPSQVRSWRKIPAQDDD